MKISLKLISLFLLVITTAFSLSAQENTPYRVSPGYPESNGPQASLTTPGSLQELELPSGRIQPQIMDRMTSGVFSFTPDGKYLAGAVDNSLVYYEVETGRLVESLAIEEGQIKDMVFSRNGNELILITGGNQIYVVHGETGRSLRSLEKDNYGNPYHRIFLSPDGELLAALSSESFDDYWSTTVTVWSSDSGKILWSEDFQLSDIINVSFSTDSSRLLVPFRRDSEPTGYREYQAVSGDLLQEVTLEESTFSRSGYAPHMQYCSMTDEILYCQEYLGVGFLDDERENLRTNLFEMVPYERYSRPILNADGTAFALTTEEELLLLMGRDFQDRRVISMDREPLGRYDSMPLKELVFDPTGEYLFVLSQVPFLYHIPTEERLPLQSVPGHEILAMEFSELSESLYCLTRMDDKIHVIHWEQSGEPEHCRVATVVSLPYLDLEEPRFQGEYSLLKTSQGMVLAEKGIHEDTRGEYHYEINLYSGETGDLLYNIRNVSSRENLTASPDGRRILLQHMTSRYASPSYALTMAFFDLESGEIQDYQVHDLSETMPGNNGPYEEHFLNNGIFIDNQTLEFDFYSDSYWSGRGDTSKVQWTIGEPFQLKLLDESDRNSTPEINSGEVVQTEDLQAIYVGGGSVAIADRNTGDILHRLYMVEPLDFYVLSEDQGRYYSSQESSLFPSVDELVLGEAVSQPLTPLFTGRVTNNGLRVRSEPNLQGELLGSLNQGDRVTAYRQSGERMTIGNATDYWYFICSETGLIGWTFGYYLER